MVAGYSEVARQLAVFWQGARLPTQRRGCSSPPRCSASRGTNVSVRRWGDWSAPRTSFATRLGPSRLLRNWCKDAEEAAPARARKGVNTLVHDLAMAFLVELIAGRELKGAAEAVREVVFSLSMALLVVTAPPTAPSDLAPPPGWSTGLKIEPMTTALTLPGDWAVEGLRQSSSEPGRRRPSGSSVLHGPHS